MNDNYLLKKAQKVHRNKIFNLEKKVCELEAKLEKAIEALEFYADKDNWNFKSKGMMSGYSYYYIEFCEKDNKAQETLVDIDKIG